MFDISIFGNTSLITLDTFLSLVKCTCCIFYYLMGIEATAFAQLLSFNQLPSVNSCSPHIESAKADLLAPTVARRICDVADEFQACGVKE